METKDKIDILYQKLLEQVSRVKNSKSQIEITRSKEGDHNVISKNLNYAQQRKENCKLTWNLVTSDQRQIQYGANESQIPRRVQRSQ